MPCNSHRLGIHIAQAVAAYDAFGGSSTPEVVGRKGDHFVGDYCVRYHATRLADSGNERFPEPESPSPPVLEQQARDVLRSLIGVACSR
jgi:arginyl-tRNA synthetase